MGKYAYRNADIPTSVSAAAFTVVSPLLDDDIVGADAFFADKSGIRATSKTIPSGSAAVPAVVDARSAIFKQQTTASDADEAFGSGVEASNVVGIGEHVQTSNGIITAPANRKRPVSHVGAGFNGTTASKQEGSASCGVGDSFSRGQKKVGKCVGSSLLLLHTAVV